MNKVAQKRKGWLDPFFAYTAHKPGLFPRRFSGSLPGTLLWTLLGAGTGRYLAAPLLSRLYPEFDEERVRRASTIMGGLAGLTPGAYLMWKTYQLGGPKGLVGGLANVKPQHPWSSDKGVPSANSQREKKSAWNTGLPTRRPVSPAWTQPSIPAGVTRNTLNTAVANGTMGVYDAANVAQIMDEAGEGDSGLISPASVARAAVNYGIGSLAGRALGATANATFSSMTPGEQKNLARGAGLGNVIFDVMGRLAAK